MTRVKKIELVDRSIELFDASIVDLKPPVDWLVSSDDNFLSHSGGVSQAVWKAAGPALARWQAETPPTLRLGDVVASPAGRLPAKGVLHAITVDFDLNRRVSGVELKALVARVLLEADRLGARSVAIPLMGTGRGALKHDAAATAIAQELESWKRSESNITRVVLPCLASGFDTMSAALDRVFREDFDVGSAIERIVLLLGEERGAPLRQFVDAVSTVPSSEEAALRLFTAALETLHAHAEMLAGAVPGSATQKSRLLPLGEALSRAVEARERAGRPLDAEVFAQCQAGIEARNRVAHRGLTSEGTERTELVALGRATESILRDLDLFAREARPHGVVKATADLKTAAAAGAGLAVAGLAGATLGSVFFPGIGSSLGATLRSALGTIGKKEPKKEPEAEPSRTRPEGVTSAASPGMTEHVRALHRLLLEHLPAGQLNELSEHLGKQGYRGERDMRLLEYCVRLPDPVQFVASEFSAEQLRKTLQQRTGATPSLDLADDALAQELLESIGFPRRPRAYGLASSLTALRRLRTRVHVVSGPALKGLVVEAGSHLEVVIAILLRFVVRVAYRSAPEPFFVSRGVLEPGRQLDRCSLGKLLELLELVSRELEEAKAPFIEVFTRDFATHRLAEKGTSEIARLRNRFAHASRGTDDGEDLHVQALEFFDAAIAALEYLGDPARRVFPRVIVVESLRIDRWGRRIYEATDDEGHAEQIFTDRLLEPGRVYFMHPLTNPLRVDPILVEAGDVLAG